MPILFKVGKSGIFPALSRPARTDRCARLGIAIMQGPALITAGQRLAAFPPCIDGFLLRQVPVRERVEPPEGGGCEAGTAGYGMHSWHEGRE